MKSAVHAMQGRAPAGGQELPIFALSLSIHPSLSLIIATETGAKQMRFDELAVADSRSE